MADFIVTRHAGAAEWLAQKGLAAALHESLDDALLARLGPGDRVFGNLPAPLVARVCETGAHYFHIDLPRQDTPAELTAAQMHEAGARLTEVRLLMPPGQSRLARWLTPKTGRQLRAFFTAFCLVAGVGLGLDLLRQGLTGVFVASTPHWRLGFGFLALAGFAIALLLAWLLWTLRHRLVEVSIRRVSLPRPKCAVVMCLSALRPPQDAEDDWALQVAEQAARLDLPEIALPTREFEERRKAAVAADPELAPIYRAASGPWQQNLRILNAQRPVLATVVVITSEGKNGSARDFPAFERLVRTLFEREGLAVSVIHAPCRPVNFEDHGALWAALSCAVEWLTGARGLAQSEIIIDATSGTKMCSIAAATMTLNSEMPMAYVNPDGQLATFDARVALVEMD